MEPAQEPKLKVTRYTVQTKFVGAVQRYERIHVSGFGDSAVFKEIDKGWFGLFENSYEAIYLGEDKPSFNPGDRVKITFEKVSP